MRRLALVGLVALAWPAGALAHANLVRSDPGFRERVDAPPRVVVLRFSQSVKLVRSSVDVRSAGGRLVSRAARAGRDPALVRAPVRALPRGAYTVRWKVLSRDGHVISGVFTFGVGVAAPPPTEAHGAAAPGAVDHAVRWAYFVALALLIGALGFRLFVLRRASLPAAAERRFYVVTGIGVVATLEVGIVAFLLRAEDALQLPFGRLLYGDLSPLASGTRFGMAFTVMTLGFALVAALVFLAWLLERTDFLWVALVLSLGFASGLSLSGHSGAAPGSSFLPALADWVHLVAASLWLGGLVQLAFVVWPAAPALRRDAFLRFSRLAGVLVAALVAAGIYLSVLRLPEVDDLWTEWYGRVLLVKLGLVALALAWGAFHHFAVRPVLERSPGEGLLARLPRSLAGESAVGMAILLAAAVLVESKPPPRPAADPPQAARSAR